ncbi:MAG: hypothetical protein JWQ71_250 [Pedosphaera sp.]|nr:hypothetical protein [Pedosphaera sp.]
MVQTYINQLSSQFPEIAAPWVETISDEKQRNSYVENIARQWLEVDPQAAGTWLPGTSLPDDRKQRLLKNK